MADIIASLRKYNFWDKTVVNLGFERTVYLSKIEAFMGNQLIKVLVGQRRTGKSYILRQLLNKIIINGVPPENTFYFNKEFVDFDSISHYTDLLRLIENYRATLKPIGKIYLFLDEIQQINEWEKLANSLSQDYVDVYELFISGSNSKMLSGELASSLSGRYISITIYPFSFKEFCQYKQFTESKASYTEYMQGGALPELFRLPDTESKRHYVSAIKDTVLLRDIIQRYQIKDAKLLEDLFIYLVNIASNIVSISSIVAYFKSKNRRTNYETLANYLGYIENTFLIHKVERYNVKGKEPISGTNKYYVNDLSFRNYLYSGFGYGVGYMLENLVYLQLKQAGYEVYAGVFRSFEVDFVAIKGNRKLYLQVAYMLVDESTIEREYRPLKHIRDNYEKWVVTLDDVAYPSDNGIDHVQAWRLSALL
jgi:predicted AAA+ superfamily ATPase